MDEVWMIPCGERKDKFLKVSGMIRLEMLILGLREIVPEDFPIKVI